MNPFMLRMEKMVKQIKDAASFIAMSQIENKKVATGTILVIPLPPECMAKLEVASIDSQIKTDFVSIS